MVSLTRITISSMKFGRFVGESFSELGHPLTLSGVRPRWHDVYWLQKPLGILRRPWSPTTSTQVMQWIYFVRYSCSSSQTNRLGQRKSSLTILLKLILISILLRPNKFKIIHMDIPIVRWTDPKSGEAYEDKVKERKHFCCLFYFK